MKITLKNKNKINPKLLNKTASTTVFVEAIEGGEVFYLWEGRGGAVLQCHDVVDDVEGDAMK
jgi:hypothetical protein